MAKHHKCTNNLHEQFASDVDLQELFALTATNCTCYINKEYNHIRNILTIDYSKLTRQMLSSMHIAIQDNNNIEHSLKYRIKNYLSIKEEFT